MTKKKFLMLAVGCFFSFVLVLSFTTKKFIASAARPESNELMPESVEVEESVDLFTNLSLTLDGGDGKVWATVKNVFTLFPSTVNVVVQLYSSLVYCEDYSQMELMAMNSIDDLDQGDTITVESSTYGEQKYWIGRVRYRENDGDWKEKCAGPVLCNAAGEYVGLS